MVRRRRPGASPSHGTLIGDTTLLAFCYVNFCLGLISPLQQEQAKVPILPILFDLQVSFVDA